MKYLIEGNLAAKETLLFSNSLGNIWSSWDKQVEAFKDQYKIVRYHTQANDGDDINSLCQNVIELIDKEELTQVHFCGISLGGLIGLNLAIHFSKYFKTITVANTSAKIVTEEIWRARIQEVQQNGFQNIKAASPAKWFSQEFCQKHPEDVAKALAGFEQTDPIDYINCCRVLGQSELWSELEAIDLPLMIIAGEFDPVTTTIEAERMAGLVKGAQLQVLKASHLSNIERPEDFNQCLSEFYQGQ